MVKVRSPRWDFLIYLVVRCGVCLLQALPMTVAYALAEIFAWLAYHVDRRHRLVAWDNLQHAFPELRQQPKKLDQMVRRVYRHFVQLAFEIVLMPRKLHVTNWRQKITLIGGEKIVPKLIADRPLLIVTGHFGNWEMAGYALGLLGFRTYAIARTLDNPYLERFLKKLREKTGQTILAKKGEFDEITGVLTSNRVLATLADQDAGQKGMFVEFFGRPASTHKAVALMALQFHAPMVVVGVPKVCEPMHYQIVVEDVIYPEEYAHQPEAARRITERYTAGLERLIRQHPEQYFWLHRRWKHQPPVKKSRLAA